MTRTVTVRTFPSGATETVITGPGGIRMGLLQLPYHEGDLYDRLLARPKDPPAPEISPRTNQTGEPL